MSKSGFIPSSLIENNDDFIALHKNKNRHKRKSLRSFSINGGKYQSWFWQEKYKVALYSIESER